MSEIDPGTPGQGLDPEVLGSDPIAACGAWLEEAYRRSQVTHPNAACLSTLGEDGWPEGRIVLVKGIDSRGFVFFTNYRSRKARALGSTARAALTFYWHDLHRQVRVQGPVEKTAASESDEYFRTRPRGSQIGAWASDQSEVLESREVLEERRREAEARFRDGNVPRPRHWGGYLLAPTTIEFWQGRDDRLHDRVVYRRDEAEVAEARTVGEGWRVSRLNP